MKEPLFALLFILTASVFRPACCQAQKRGQALIDSLEQVLPGITADTAAVQVLNALSKEYRKQDLSRAAQTADRAMAIAERIKWQKGIAASLRSLARIQMEKKDPSAALELEQQSLSINTAINNLDGQGENYSFLGSLALDQNNYRKATGYFEKALHIFMQLRDDQKTGVALSNLATSYTALTDYPKAIELYKKAIELHRKNNEPDQVAKGAVGIGNVYWVTGSYTLANEYYLQALRLYEGLGNKRGVANACEGLARVFNHNGECEQALGYLRKSVQLNQESGARASLAYNYFNMGKCYSKLLDFPQAETYMKMALELFIEFRQPRAIATTRSQLGFDLIRQEKYLEGVEMMLAALPIIIESGDRLNEGITLREISSCYVKLYQRFSVETGKRLNTTREALYATALEYIKRAIAIDEELKAPDQLVRAYEVMAEVYEGAGDFRNANIYLRKAELLEDTLFSERNAKTVTALREQFETEKKENEIRLLQQQKSMQELLLREQRMQVLRQEQDLLLASQDKEIQGLELQNKDAQLTAQKLLTRDREKEVALLHKDRTIQAVTLKNIQKNRNMIVAALIGALLLSGVIFYWRNKHSKLRFQHQLTETELNLFRSQMNPHFVFNALNSIYSYVITNQRQNAAKYLHKFSELMHIILENSSNKLVTLADDLKALELYLELEAERLDHKFSYDIKVDDDLDADKVMVPPMILQPFLENSVWHGMLKKEKDGRIQLHVGRNGELLECVITDNGGGFRKSNGKGLKEGKKSYGIGITRQRIENLNKTYKVNGYCDVLEIMDEHAVPAGVKVRVAVPLELGG